MPAVRVFALLALGRSTLRLAYSVTSPFAGVACRLTAVAPAGSSTR